MNRIFVDSNNELVLDWNFTDEDLKNLKNSIKDLNIIFNEMNQNLRLKIFLIEITNLRDYLRRNIFGIGHHMGTTRMGFNK